MSAVHVIRTPDERVAAPCVVCGHGGPHPVHLHAVIGTDGACTVLRCAGCDSRFVLGPMLPERSDWQWLPAEQDMRLELHGPDLSGLDALLHPMFHMERAGNPAATRRMLHLGCGFGWLVDAARRVLRWDAVGYDARTAADEGGRLLGPHIQQDLPPPDALPTGPFDLVLVTDALELAADAGALLGAIAARLAPGGRVIVSARDGAAAVITPHDLPTLENAGWGRVQCLPTAAGLLRAAARAGLHGPVAEARNRVTLTAGRAPPMPQTGAAAGAAVPLLRRAYLSALVQQTPPGGPLWHGAAARLFTVLADAGACADALALFDAIAAAPGDPFSGPALLLARAQLENTTPGRDPAAVLPWVRRAYTAAADAAARAVSLGLDPAPLHATGRDARAALLLVMAEIAPEVAADMAGALARPSAMPDDAWRLPPVEARIRALTPTLLRATRNGQWWDAARVDWAFSDRDAVRRALNGPALADVEAALASVDAARKA